MAIKNGQSIETDNSCITTIISFLSFIVTIFMCQAMVSLTSINLQKKILKIQFSNQPFFLDVYLGDNCIVMKIFTASIGDLMATN